ncbi:hypothetical protein LWI28_017142 [Acer negundo]|uniref:Gnk2-homologous domain-containing protein n=1 Tax=Acer negundo TaxID=4023 RepID=A0AAD5IM11_ACENE|nr:hypothetical protein LWI28_017142 [Acer negundo]
MVFLLLQYSIPILILSLLSFSKSSPPPIPSLISLNCTAPSQNVVVNSTTGDWSCSNQTIIMDWRIQFEAAFETLLLRLRADMAIKVLGVVSSQLMRFSTGEVQYGNRSSQVVYGLAECVHNVSHKDCEVCLEKSNDNLLKCCGGGDNYKDGGTVVVAGHCMVRYETYKFFSRVRSGGGLDAGNGSSSSGAVNVLIHASAKGEALTTLLHGEARW